MKAFLDNTFLLSLMFAVCFLVTAGILYFFPRKKVNHFYGYRTPRSIRSQEQWDFSQKYFATQMAKAAIMVAAFSIIGIWLPESKDLRLWISIFIVVLAIRYMYGTTEAALKKRFKN